MRQNNTRGHQMSVATKLTVLEGLQVKLLFFLACHLRDNRVAPAWSASLPYRSLSFPLWTPLSSQHSFLNEIQDH